MTEPNVSGFVGNLKSGAVKDFCLHVFKNKNYSEVQELRILNDKLVDVIEKFFVDKALNDNYKKLLSHFGSLNQVVFTNHYHEEEQKILERIHGTKFVADHHQLEEELAYEKRGVEPKIPQALRNDIEKVNNLEAEKNFYNKKIDVLKRKQNVIAKENNRIRGDIDRIHQEARELSHRNYNVNHDHLLTQIREESVKHDRSISELFTRFNIDDLLNLKVQYTAHLRDDIERLRRQHEEKVEALLAELRVKLTNDIRDIQAEEERRKRAREEAKRLKDELRKKSLTWKRKIEELNAKNAALRSEEPSRGDDWQKAELARLNEEISRMEQECALLIKQVEELCSLIGILEEEITKYKRLINDASLQTPSAGYNAYASGSQEIQRPYPAGTHDTHYQRSYTSGSHDVSTRPYISGTHDIHHQQPIGSHDTHLHPAYSHTQTTVHESSHSFSTRPSGHDETQIFTGGPSTPVPTYTPYVPTVPSGGLQTSAQTYASYESTIPSGRLETSATTFTPYVPIHTTQHVQSSSYVPASHTESTYPSGIQETRHTEVRFETSFPARHSDSHHISSSHIESPIPTRQETLLSGGHGLGADGHQHSSHYSSHQTTIHESRHHTGGDGYGTRYESVPYSSTHINVGDPTSRYTSSSVSPPLAYVQKVQRKYNGYVKIGDVTSSIVRLENRSTTQAIDVSNFILENVSGRFIIPSNTIIGPKSVLVIHAQTSQTSLLQESHKGIYSTIPHFDVSIGKKTVLLNTRQEIVATFAHIENNDYQL